MSETDFVFQGGDREKLTFRKGPFVMTENGVRFTPEFERDVIVDSMVLDWQNTVERTVIFGQEYAFEGEGFNPTISLMRVFGIERHKGDEQQDRLVKLLSAEEPNILLIHGHGVQKGDRWKISASGRGEELVDVEDFLRGPVKRQVEQKPYDLIVFDACSANRNGVGTYKIPQEVVDEVNTPIYYIQGISSTLYKADRILAEPSQNE